MFGCLKIKMKNKSAKLLYEIIIHLILITLIFGLFFISTTYRANSKGVRQQIIEKQTALLIDSAPAGTRFFLKRENPNGKINNIDLKDGRIYAYVDDNQFSKGYPYFSEHDVNIEKEEKRFVVKIG